MDPAQENTSFWQQTRGLTWPFWVANFMEMIERLAYYGQTAILSVYLRDRLHFNDLESGTISATEDLSQTHRLILPDSKATLYIN